MRSPRFVAAVLALGLFCRPALADITLNLKDADINTLILAVSEVTGKNFIVDPQVQGRVTVISSSPMNDAAVYETFLAVLQTQGFAAVPAGKVIKIVPEADARSDAGSTPRTGQRLPGDDVVTRVFQLKGASAAQLNPLVRPLLSPWAHLAAYPSSNSLIISDRAGNVSRIEEIVRQLEQAGDQSIDRVVLEHASAADVARIATTLLQQGKGSEGGLSATVVADERSNSVLIAGDSGERRRMVALIAQLDMPAIDAGSTQVVYLRYASAENLASVIEGYAQKLGDSKAASGAGASSAAPATESRVIAEKDTNALVITAPPKAMKQIRAVIDQLDIQRDQVLVEAIIAEVSTSRQAELGLNFAAYNPKGGAVASVLDASVLSALGALSSGGSGAIGSGVAALGQGILLGGGRLQNDGGNGTSFGLLLKALQGDGATNVLSTPSLVSLDNQESEVSVGQEVPFLSGSYTSNGVSSANGAVNPFQTIERKDVGLKLGVTPQINKGNTVKLKIKLESSSVAAGSAGTANLVTNKRTIANTVNVESGQVLVLGGLIDDNLNESKSGVPLLGDLPVLGNLFRSRAVTKSKRNLMVFIHPVILRNSEDTARYTERKYEQVREAQLETAKRPVPLLGGSRPLLLKIDQLLAPLPAPAAGAADRP